MKKFGYFQIYVPARKKKWFDRALKKAARARGCGRSRLLRLALKHYLQCGLPEYLEK